LCKFMRYLVGLPNDLVLDDNYNNYAQHGTVLLARLRGIAHYPQNPVICLMNFTILHIKELQVPVLHTVFHL